MKNIDVVLSGCGVQDGSEIHEAALTLLFLDKAGVRIQCYAPDMTQYHTVNHSTEKVQEKEKRRVLIEYARIADGIEKLVQKIVEVK